MRPAVRKVPLLELELATGLGWVGRGRVCNYTLHVHIYWGVLAGWDGWRKRMKHSQYSNSSVKKKTRELKPRNDDSARNRRTFSKWVMTLSGLGPPLTPFPWFAQLANRWGPGDLKIWWTWAKCGTALRNLAINHSEFGAELVGELLQDSRLVYVVLRGGLEKGLPPVVLFGWSC